VLPISYGLIVSDCEEAVFSTVVLGNKSSAEKSGALQRNYDVGRNIAEIACPTALPAYLLPPEGALPASGLNFEGFSQTRQTGCSVFR
jgi:hypothetical protein